jgi:hypothetical protein
MEWNPLGMFADALNYPDRAVARDEFPWGMVDTCAVSDVPEPYETAIAHEDYGNGSGGGMVIVEAYQTRDEALAGHKRWIEIMTTTQPEYLEQKGGHDYRGTKYYRQSKEATK